MRDALGLIAFLALVLLVAFRTKKVPELFFGLLRDKLTRQQFSTLLHRFMTLSFVAFLALLPLAVLSQVLSHLTQPNALTVSDLRRELANAKASEDQKIHAEAQYRQAMEKLNERDFNGAIASLQESIKTIPTLTAQEMLAYLYRQKRDFANASDAWEAAVKTARERGDTLALARLDINNVPRAIPDVEGEHDLIGTNTPLPRGGTTYENAVNMSPGFYGCTDTEGCHSWWFKLSLRAGQSLDVKFRSRASFDGHAGYALADIFGTNGERTTSGGTWAGPPSKIYQVGFVAPVSGEHFLRIEGERGTVYRIQVR